MTWKAEKARKQKSFLMSGLKKSCWLSSPFSWLTQHIKYSKFLFYVFCLFFLCLYTFFLNGMHIPSFLSSWLDRKIPTRYKSEMHKWWLLVTLVILSCSLIDIFRSRRSCLMTSVKGQGCKFVNQLTDHFHFSVEN